MMLGTNELTLNTATVTEAVQMYLDSMGKTPGSLGYVVEVKQGVDKLCPVLRVTISSEKPGTVKVSEAEGSTAPEGDYFQPGKE